VVGVKGTDPMVAVSPHPVATASDARTNAPTIQRAVRLFDRRTIVSIPGGEP
jgi:hypothetical protein